MKNDTFSGSDFWERNVMEIDHHKEQNSSPETSQTCTTRLGSLHQKLPRHVQHVWVLFSRNFPDMYNTSGLIKWAKRGQPC